MSNPAAASGGTTAWTSVSDHDVAATQTRPDPAVGKHTLPATVPKFVPLIVIGEPGHPSGGTSADIVYDGPAGRLFCVTLPITHGFLSLVVRSATQRWRSVSQTLSEAMGGSGHGGGKGLVTSRSSASMKRTVSPPSARPASVCSDSKSRRPARPRSISTSRANAASAELDIVSAAAATSPNFNSGTPQFRGCGSGTSSKRPGTRSGPNRKPCPLTSWECRSNAPV